MRPLDLSGFTVMVVDNNTEIASLLKQALEALGVGSVRTFGTGADAIRFLQQVRDNPDQAGVMQVDFVMANWQAGTEDGPDVLTWTRNHSDPINRFIGFIAVCQSGDLQTDKDPRQAGADEILESPFTVDSLAAALVRLIAFPRQYVQTPTYFGPDRRLEAKALSEPDRRRLTDKSTGVKVIYG
ncbi:response regulator [Sneathiella chinensis]|uniref:Response regulator n=1 Tax=Sneathiella chinensis TaxID=349750 RepID=A0ABQ5U311_9PROT|nr:response regulator [Sneathiella chinensis]GLQ06035.1 response regulator [Sneathiella chinensis]